MLPMDNFAFDIVAYRGYEKDDPLDLAMRVAFLKNGKAERYLAGKSLIFYWGVENSYTSALLLPFKLDYLGAADWTRRWLAEQDYGPQPDHDGDNSKGWRVYNTKLNDPYAIVEIRPVWAEHGK